MKIDLLTDDLSDKKVLISLSAGINSAALLCYMAKHYPQEEKPKQLYIYYVHLIEHSPDSFKFVADCIRYAYKHFECVHWAIKWDSVLRFFKQQHMIPHPIFSPCSEQLKMIPIHNYMKKHQIDIDLVGFIRAEKNRINRQVKKGVEGKAYPIALLSDKDCFDLVDNEIGWHPAIYDIKDKKGKRVFQHNNCFTGDTKFITSLGTKTFAECVNKSVRVIGHNGRWTDATVQEFGNQRIVKLILSRYGTKKEVYTTENHLWFVRLYNGKEKLVMTKDLQENDRLITRYSYQKINIFPSPFGIVHGITYGDGTLPIYYQQDKKNWNPAARVVLCGEKDKELLKYFSNCQRRNCDAGITVDGLPHYFRQLPSITESASYLMGWLAGYFAADGNVSDNGRASLSSANFESLQFARDVAHNLGYKTTGIGCNWRYGFNKEKSPMYRLSFQKGYLPPEFFLIEQHKQRAMVERSTNTKDWRVRGVKVTDRVERVYCAIVPKGNAFVLDDNLLTHNCLPCKNFQGRLDDEKATKDYHYVQLYYPEYFDKAKALSDEMGLYWGRTDKDADFDGYCKFCEY